MQHSTNELLIPLDSPLALGSGFLPAEGTPGQIISRAISGLAANPEIACEIILAATSMLADSPTDTLLLRRENGLDSSIVEVGAVADIADFAGLANTGARSYFRISFQVPVYQTIELYIFSSLDPGRLASRQYELLAYTMAHWPAVRHGIRAEYSPFSPREVRCLAQAYAGYTAKETSVHTGWPERTVVMHLSNATSKAGAKNKLAALQWATLMGHFF